MYRGPRRNLLFPDIDFMSSSMVLLGVGWTVLPLAGLGALDGLRVVRRDLVVRRLVLVRRAGARPDAAVDELAAALEAGAR